MPPLKNKSLTWIITFFILLVGILCIIAIQVIRIDPYFHYHAPDTDTYFYSLDNPRSQNDGIVKHFDYDAIITGTSMTENFKTSEMDKLFNVSSIKVAFPGATYKEVNDNLIRAFQNNPNIKIVIRALDMDFFF